MAISDCSNTPGYQRNDADVHTVCKLAEALRDAIVEYQVGDDLRVPDMLGFFADAWIVCTTKGNI